MGTERTTRVSEVIRRELSVLLRREVELEGLLLTISGVNTTPDLKQAFVFLSVIEQTMSNPEIMRLLNKHKRSWQTEIGRRLSTKFTPRLHFQFDESIERGDRIMQLLHEIEEEQKPA